MARFIVGTGRCGSTLLSRMLAESDRVCSLFEVFSGIDQFFRFRTDPVTGEELAQRLAEDHPMLTMVLSRGYEVPEVAYPFAAPGARYRRSDPIPWNLAIAVSRLGPEPDALFDELLAFARSLPEQPLRRHYPSLLDWLTRRVGRELWVEKSGTSIEFAPELQSFFPGARFVHLHRDGPETALSMREYSVLRLAVPVMNGLLGEVEYSHEGLVEFERRNRDAIDRTLASRPPAELFGRYWSGQVERGVPALARVGPESVHEVRFEELVSRPAPVLAEVADFLGIPRGGTRDGSGWIASAAALVKGMPPARVPELDPDERRALEAACRPGMELLGRA